MVFLGSRGEPLVPLVSRLSRQTFLISLFLLLLFLLLLRPGAGCGRVASTLSSSTLLQILDSSSLARRFFKNAQDYDSQARFNCGPGHFLPVLLKAKPGNIEKTKADKAHIEAGKCEGTKLEVNDSVKHPKRVHVKNFDKGAGVIEEDEEKNEKDKEKGTLEWVIQMDEMRGAGSVVKTQDARIPGLKFKVEEQKGTDEMLKEEVEAKVEVHEEKSAAVDKEAVEVVVEAMRWGLVPSYCKAQTTSEALKEGWKMINARDDNLLRVHGRLLDTKRCVVVVDGFYEWLAPMKPSPANLSSSGKEHQSSAKRPFFMRRPDSRPLYLAGLYDSWHATVAEGSAEGSDHETQEGGLGWSRSGEGGEGLLRTHTIITTESNSQLGWLHERMPVILEDSDVPLWLDTARFRFNSPDVQNLLQPYGGLLEVFEVSVTVSNIRNNIADCLLPLTEYNAMKRKTGIGSFFTTSSPTQKTKSGPVVSKRESSKLDLGCGKVGCDDDDVLFVGKSKSQDGKGEEGRLACVGEVSRSWGQGDMGAGRGWSGNSSKECGKGVKRNFDGVLEGDTSALTSPTSAPAMDERVSKSQQQEPHHSQSAGKRGQGPKGEGGESAGSRKSAKGAGAKGGAPGVARKGTLSSYFQPL